MRGKPNTYAVNGHTRHYSICSGTGAETKYITYVAMSTTDCHTKVGNARIEITRAQAADILWQHRAMGCTINVDMGHNEHCLCNPNDPRKQPWRVYKEATA